MTTRFHLKINSFTLVEVIAATAVSVMIALIIGMASVSFYKSYIRAQKYSSAINDYQSIDLLADSCFRNMVYFTWRDGTAGERVVFEGAPDTMFFTSLRRSSGLTQGPLIFVRLKLEDGLLVAEYSNLPRFPWMSDGEYTMTREILSRNVKSLSFKYAEKISSSNTVEWIETWDEDNNPDIPLAVLMKIEWNDGRAEQWLRRTAGVSSNSTYGNRKVSTVNQ